MLELKDVRVKNYRGDIIKGVSLECRAGENVCLLGANGAGKTTLAHCIGGLLNIDGGEILFCGERIDRTDMQKRVLAGMVLLPGGRSLFDRMTVEENLLLGAYLCRDKKAVKERLASVYALFPRLFEMKGRIAGNLSGGEGQTVAIGRALMSSPRFLILDEPSVGLSPIMTENLYRATKKINEWGVGTLITEQRTEGVIDVADRVYVMENGRIAMQGMAEEIKKEEGLMKAYLGLQSSDIDK